MDTCAQEKGAGPYHEYAGKHGRFGYRNPDHVNRDGYVSDNDYGAGNLAYYGDWDASSIYIFDVDNMRLLTTVENTGEGPHGIDQQSPGKAYALTRKTESLTVVNKGVSLEMQYFYSAASHDGVLYRINLDTWNVVKTEPVDANLLMGSFIWDGDGMM